MSDQIQFPTTIESFVKSVWYSKVKTMIRNFRLNEDIDDTMSGIVCELIEKNYLSRWDSSAGSYSNWIYTFAGNICRKKHNRSHTKGGSAIENAASIKSSPDSDDDFSGNFYFDSFLEDRSVSIDMPIFIKEIEVILSQYKANSSNVFNGVRYDRDMLSVFRMSVRGFSPKEIAERFATSVEFTYTLLRKIRTILSQELVLA